VNDRRPADGTAAQEDLQRGGDRQRLRRYGPALLCIAVYGLLAAFAYGVHPPATSTTLPPCGCGDISSQVWFTEWPAYALGSGHNPFFSSFVAYPLGINLMTNTGTPLLGILFAPVTLLFGPIAAFNLIMRLSFALSAISMCFVLRRWTKWWPAAFAGGLLYGFSPFMVGQGTGHDFLSFAPLPPLVVALLDELVVRRRHPLRNGVLLGVVVVAQLLISPEVLVMTLLLCVVGLLVLAVRHPVAAVERARDVGGGFLAALVTFAVLGGYPLWAYFRGPQHIAGAPHPVALLSAYHDAVLSVFVPTVFQRFTIHSWLARGTLLTQGNAVEHATYIGIPLLCLLAVIAVRCRRSGPVQLFSLMALGAWTITLGSVLYLDLSPHPAFKLPYDLLYRLPIVDGALDTRYALMMYLALAVVLAIGLDRLCREGLFTRRGREGTARSWRWTPRWRAAVCVLVAVVALLPLVPSLPYQSTSVKLPPVLTASDSLIAKGAVVLTYPLPVGYEGINDQALLWQAASGMDYKLIGFRGAVAGRDHKPLTNAELLLPPTQAERLLVWALYGQPSPPPPDDAATWRAIRAFLARYDVGDVAVTRSGLHWHSVLRYYTSALGVPPATFGRAFVWPHVQRDLARFPAPLG
jgi:hypothetical protein